MILEENTRNPNHRAHAKDEQCHSVQKTKIQGQRNVRTLAGTLTPLGGPAIFGTSISRTERGPFVHGNPKTFRSKTSTDFLLAADPRASYAKELYHIGYAT